MKEDANQNKIKSFWNNWSADYYKNTFEKIGLLKENPERAFPTPVWNMLNEAFPTFKGLRICVPSSGDNNAVFAFHLLGAQVFSCDLSENQLQNASCIARENHWDITFKNLNTMDLSAFEDNSFDLVYTSNGVHVWIPDLLNMYRGFHRILTDNGKYIFFETHPFNRPFDDSTNELNIKMRYSAFVNDDGVPNYLWRVQDFVNSLVRSGFTIQAMEEIFAEKHVIGASWWKEDEWDRQSDMTHNPYAALPQWISFMCGK